MGVDYRRSKRCTVGDSYCIPWIHECDGRLWYVTISVPFDTNICYLQIKIAKKDKEKTAICDTSLIISVQLHAVWIQSHTELISLWLGCNLIYSPSDICAFLCCGIVWCFEKARRHISSKWNMYWLYFTNLASQLSRSRVTSQLVSLPPGSCHLTSAPGSITKYNRHV